MRIAIYTAIFGNYDDLIEDQPDIPGATYICFTDNMSVISKTWQIVRCVPKFPDSNRSAKHYKIHPHKYLKNYDHSIWIDGNVQISSIPSEFLSSDYLVFDHGHRHRSNARNCLYEEANVVIEKGLDDPFIVRSQVHRYREDGYPENNGLAVNTVILRSHNKSSVIAVMEAWWTEIAENSKRDQLSFDYVAWKQCFRYDKIHLDVYHNSFFRIRPHRRIVIYTAIFGGYDSLIEDQTFQRGVDYVCFTDTPGLYSANWKVIHEKGWTDDDPNRNAKLFKILPHKFFPDHDYSIWVDGNVKVVGNLDEILAPRYAVFNHGNNRLDPRNCIYEEAAAVVRLRKDDPEIVCSQISRYLEEGYPMRNGLAVNSVILRQHRHPDVVRSMDLWWREIVGSSHRDQLSFNYVAWKTGLDFEYLDGDSRSNRFFRQASHHNGPPNR